MNNCTTCDKIFSDEKSRHFHKCSGITIEIVKNAWLGDLEHKHIVAQWFLYRGFGPEISHSYYASYISNWSQARYLDVFDLLPEITKSASDHNKGQWFEAEWHTNKSFRDMYIRRMLPFTQPNYVYTPLSREQYTAIVTNAPPLNFVYNAVREYHGITHIPMIFDLNLLKNFFSYCTKTFSWL